METLNNNILIAKFLGWDKYNNGVYDTPFEDASYCNGEPTNTVIFPQYLKFHSDWRWLMAAVEHIETLIVSDCEVELDCVGKDARFILSDGCRFLGAYNSGETKMESVYIAVIEFIDYYNENVVK